MIGAAGAASDDPGFRLARTDALFLDLDGTLADIGPDPQAIHLDGATHAALERLAAALDGALAVISGRDLRDLAGRTPAVVWRAGGHGLEVLAPGRPLPPPLDPPPRAVLDALRVAARHPGVRLEIKGPVAALHYRAAPRAEAACLAAAAHAAKVPGHVAQAGKMVVEVKPAAAHKGHTLRRLVETAPFAGRRPVMLGDDTTDEDAMAAAQDLGGIGIKVGPGPSVAQVRFADPATVRRWLAREAASLG